MTEVDDFLLHFGVKGMKWGQRKSDESSKAPSARQEARSEKREGKARTLDGRVAKLDITIKELNAELKTIPKGPRGAYSRNQARVAIRDTSKYRDGLSKQAKAVREGKLSTNQKLLIGGSIVAVGLLAAGYASTKVDSGEFNAMKLQGAAFLQGKKFGFRPKPEFARKMSPDDVLSTVVKGINPNYRSAGGSMNCRRTALAYELRRRGLDVVATTTERGNGQSESGLINALTPGQKNQTYVDSLSQNVASKGNIRGQAVGDTRKNNAETYSVKDSSNYKDLLATFAKQPNGARGEIVFNFEMFGHAMAYEIFDGKPVIFDAQKASKHPVTEEGMAKMQSKWGAPKDAAITRLDNMDLDMKFLARWATNT